MWRMRVEMMASLAAMAVAMPSLAYATPKVGQPAPDFTVTTFGGHKISLADLKGDVIILNFWATWCAPCKEELPLLELAFRTYAKNRLQVLAVTTEDSVPAYQLKPLAGRLTIPLIKTLKGPYEQLEGVPTNYVIDRTGKLVYAKAGAFNIDTINTFIVPLLNEPLPAEPPADPTPEAAKPKPGF